MPRTLLLLHGTGGNEEDLLPLGPLLDPQAALLSPRGDVLENGMPRFFRRLSEGVFDVDDLVMRAKAMADFVSEARATYPLGPVLEPVQGRPVDNVGLYAQVDTGRFIRRLFHITVGLRHRMTAIEDTDVVEVSTPELDDVVRLEDRYGRSS